MAAYQSVSTSFLFRVLFFLKILLKIGLTKNGLQLGYSLLRELGGCGLRHCAARELAHWKGVK